MGKSELQRANLLMKQLDEEWIVSVCRAMDTDGKGVDRLEFVVGMLTHMGVELCGHPLEWSDVKPLLAQFDAADKTHDGRLKEDDVREMMKLKRASAAEKWASANGHPPGGKVAPDVHYDT